jgi:hypothetical protein
VIEGGREENNVCGKSECPETLSSAQECNERNCLPKSGTDDNMMAALSNREQHCLWV